MLVAVALVHAEGLCGGDAAGPDELRAHVAGDLRIGQVDAQFVADCLAVGDPLDFSIIVGLKRDCVALNNDVRDDGVGRIFVTHVLRLVVWLMFGEWVKDANTPFRLMKADRLLPILQIIPEDFFLSNVAVCVIAIKQKETFQWFPITFKPRQGGENSINMKRIFKIGQKALGDFRSINKRLNNHENT